MVMQYVIIATKGTVTTLHYREFLQESKEFGQELLDDAFDVIVAEMLYTGVGQSDCRLKQS